MRNLSAAGRRSGHIRKAIAALAGLAVAAGLTATTLPAQAAESYFCPDNTQPYVPVATVEAYSAGQEVSGLSVTSGTTPTSFTGSYVGYIADGLGTHKDLLLFKLSSPVIDGTSSAGLKAAGIWSGMSGSPVYDGSGRLIGAVSYSLNADNLPIAGVTPAEYMKSIGTTSVGSTSKVSANRSNLKISTAGARVAGTALTSATFTEVKAVKVAGKSGVQQNAFTNRTLARTPSGNPVASFLRSKSFSPAGVTKSSLTSPLVAGGSIATLYSSGDAVIGAIGTVTAVCGTSVWAFGHPMEFSGATQMLMANASTAMIVPDGTGVSGSYKQVSTIGEPLGMITEDRLMGIKGTVGTTTSFPIALAVQNAKGVKVADYTAAVAEPLAGPSTVASLVGTAAYEHLDQYSSGTATVTWTIRYRRANGATGSLSNSAVVNATSYFPDTIAGYAASDLAEIVNNSFEDVTITRLDATLKLISADSISYKPRAVQVFTKGKWNQADGARLKAGLTYSFRPAYQVMKNGKAGKTAVGSVARIKIKSSSGTSGTFAIAATTTPADSCDGGSECTDYGTDTDPASFDDLIAQLENADPGNVLEGVVTYTMKKKNKKTQPPTVITLHWTMPGAVAGKASASFGIKH